MQIIVILVTKQSEIACITTDCGDSQLTGTNGYREW